MVELHITQTAKGYAPKEKWYAMTTEHFSFRTVEEAKAWLRGRYGASKRVPMYQEGSEGESKQVGYVYGFRNSDVSHVPVVKWLQQDWVEFRVSEAMAIDRHLEKWDMPQ